MREQLYKAVFRFSVTEYLRGDPRGIARIGTRASQWFHDNGRADHYVNSYLNDCPQGDIMEWVVVMNDRTTAIMLKLALN